MERNPSTPPLPPLHEWLPVLSSVTSTWVAFSLTGNVLLLRIAFPSFSLSSWLAAEDVSKLRVFDKPNFEILASSSSCVESVWTSTSWPWGFSDEAVTALDFSCSSSMWDKCFCCSCNCFREKEGKYMYIQSTDSSNKQKNTFNAIAKKKVISCGSSHWKYCCTCKNQIRRSKVAWNQIHQSVAIKQVYNNSLWRKNSFYSTVYHSIYTSLLLPNSFFHLHVYALDIME